MGTKTIATKVDEDGELYANFQTFVEKHDTKSEATRRLLREGLSNVQDADPPAGWADLLTTVLADDAYILLRDGVLSAAILLMLSAVITAFSPWWASAALNTAVFAGAAVGITAAFGGIIGAGIRAWDRFGPEVTVESSDNTGAEA